MQYEGKMISAHHSICPEISGSGVSQWYRMEVGGRTHGIDLAYIKDSVCIIIQDPVRVETARWKQATPEKSHPHQSRY